MPRLSFSDLNVVLSLKRFNFVWQCECEKVGQQGDIHFVRFIGEIGLPQGDRRPHMKFSSRDLYRFPMANISHQSELNAPPHGALPCNSPRRLNPGVVGFTPWAPKSFQNMTVNGQPPKCVA